MPYKPRYPQTWRALAVRKRKMADRWEKQAALKRSEADALDEKWFAYVAKRDGKPKARVSV